jgi:glycosyltransferase involved in cell wall biosynthesis
MSALEQDRGTRVRHGVGGNMNGRPIAYVMEQTLGSVTHYLNLKRHGTAAAGAEPRWIPIDYSAGRLPWTVRGSLSARAALRPIISEVAGVFIHTTTLAPLCVDYFRHLPVVLSTDGTPMNKRNMRGLYGLKAENRAAEWMKRTLYREVFGRANAFVGWSTWAKQSFVEDYGCKDEDVAVIPPGIDLEQFAPGDRAHELPRILFVGGDFERKGGDLLLDVFRKRLRGKAELVLVTRSGPPSEPGVSVHGDVQANSPELRRLYATSDIFALPTRADCYSIVAMEAMAAGIPVVATRVGGIPDVIRQEETGYLVEVDAAGALGDALEALVVDPARRRRMSEACRADAMRRFDIRENARRLFQFVRSRC